ncbi:MAG: formate dehydrogenase accessory sulfurtransferase FdhD [Actinomycetota bacterium]|nr:formate dehydrogenase accessory sulfurtransferase FdhD [Actinomycetota bacterium]MDH4352697.1 formate dehydrogenase accessory sulfurtransferase FdhD [Actinomycetota bacterium]MDH5279457.1 formate dehydrogenase accessory sulfurtransferase FdhD [Actinomycetota bacterium]
MSRSTTRRKVVRIRDGVVDERVDSLAVESPLTVRLGSADQVDQLAAVLTTMRTPGHDIDLALGWLVAEGVLLAPEDVTEARECRRLDDDGNVGETVEVRLRTDRRPRERLSWASSACGACGTIAIESVVDEAKQLTRGSGLAVDRDLVLGLPDQLRQHQRAFSASGGLHAAGLFDAEGSPLCIREDVGRHNAVDKVVGWAFREGLLPLDRHVIQLSGRASFELVQKAAMSGVSVLAAVSAPSSLAVELAEATGVLLAGFVRGGSMNVYTHPDRLLDATAAPADRSVGEAPPASS